MRGLVKEFDQYKQCGVILFGLDEVPFRSEGVNYPVILARGDQVQFNLRDRGRGPEAFDIRPLGPSPLMK